MPEDRTATRDRMWWHIRRAHYHANMAKDLAYQCDTGWRVRHVLLSVQNKLIKLVVHRDPVNKQ